MKRIVCYGDSNTWGYTPGTGARYPEDVRWTGRLQRALGPDYAVIEEGMNGRTTIYEDPTDPDRNGKKHLRACLMSQAPVDVLILMLGTNDLKTRFFLTAKDVADGAANLVKMAKSAEYGRAGQPPRILLAAPPLIGEGIAHSPFGEGMGGWTAVERSRQFGAYYEKAARELGVAFIDIGQVAAGGEVDAIHLTAQAHAAIAQAMEQAVRNLCPDAP